MWRPDEGCHTGTPSLSTAGFLLLPAFDATIHLQPASTMIGRMTGAFGADDVVSLGPQFRKLRFQMIADRDPGMLRFRAISHPNNSISCSDCVRPTMLWM